MVAGVSQAIALTHEQFAARLSAFLARTIDGFRELAHIERLSGGASQETYSLRVATNSGDRKLAMRRSPGGGKRQRMPGHPGLRTEALLMQCAREAGVPEPQVIGVLDDATGLGEGFVMEWIDGESRGARIVRHEEFAGLRSTLAYECGQILARIHAINLTATGLDKLLDPLTPSELVEQTWQSYQRLETPQPMIDFTARWLNDHLPSPDQSTLVHSDFRIGNLLVTAEHVSAVLDWELAHIGDPMRDLGWICTNSWRFGGAKAVGGCGEYTQLFAGYESISKRRVDAQHVKFWEVFGSFWWAANSLVMAGHYRTGPDKSVEQPGIGRRTSECQIDCVNLLIPGAYELINASPLDSNLPRTGELVSSVRDFLRAEVMSTTTGRSNFLTRVASNSLDIVLRELEIGEAHRRNEHSRLANLLSADEGLAALRWKLVRALRDGSMPLNAPGLAEHLRVTVANQVAIDQPAYSGLTAPR